MRGGHGGSEAIHAPNDAVSHVGDIEIEKIAHLEPAESQVTQELAAMNWQRRLDGFDFDHDETIYEKIDPVGIVHQKAAISKRD